jgi:hypothetical protein
MLTLRSFLFIDDQSKRWRILSSNNLCSRKKVVDIWIGTAKFYLDNVKQLNKHLLFSGWSVGWEAHVVESEIVFILCYVGVENVHLRVDRRSRISWLKWSEADEDLSLDDDRRSPATYIKKNCLGQRRNLSVKTHFKIFFDCRFQENWHKYSYWYRYSKI